MNEISEKAVEEICIALFDAVSRANLTRDVKTPERKVAVARPFLTAALPHVVGEVVAVAEPMPGASRFTMACFEADKVQPGTKLYAPTNQERGSDGEPK